MISKPEFRCFLVSKDIVVPLSSDAPVVLGRDPTVCTHVLSDERVSRVHAMVLLRDNQYYVKDLNSSNGTIVNDRKVTSAVLLDSGDIISIPPFKLEFVRPDYAQVDEAIETDTLNRLNARNRLEGSLATLPITDLIQLLNATRQNGTLSIADDENNHAALAFRDGEIVHAQYASQTGEEAVYALIRNKRGGFEFTKSEQDDPLHHAEQRIKRRTQSLLLEGARLLDEKKPDTQRLDSLIAR